MNARVRILLLASGLALGCASTVDVRVEDDGRLAGLRTWNWLPAGAGVRAAVDAPHRDARALQARLGRAIEAELDELGFRRSAHADFYVIYHLLLAQRKVTVNVPSATQTLSSMTSDGSYLIDGNVKETREYEDLRLIIGLLPGPGEVSWKGVLQRHVAAGEGLGLEDAVARLLERLPAPPDETRFAATPP